MQNLAGRNHFEGPGIDNPEGLAAEKLRRYRTFEDAARAPPIHGAEVAALDDDQKEPSSPRQRCRAISSITALSPNWPFSER
ncbi:hypothetical protein [Sphingopyxis sp.]|uniref:hypothetical protein n=1 Tax=Sphingopyxis sp. TaxID=1908224 RepID=UPI003BA9B59E